MATLQELASNEDIRAEYSKALLLNLLKKLVSRMKNDSAFKKHIMTLYKESTNTTDTTSIILKRYFSYEASNQEIQLMTSWVKAFLNKGDRRKPIPESIKTELYNKQNGRCAVCGEELGNDGHVDHIIPWTLVGDELPDNYQYLCSSCNESKSCHTDYIFKNLLKLI